MSGGIVLRLSANSVCAGNRAIVQVLFEPSVDDVSVKPQAKSS